MHTENLQLMSTMLGEVIAGTWKPTQRPMLNKIAREEVGKRTTKEVKFDLSAWVALKSSKRSECGFSACAVGHAMLDRRFFDAGLRAEISGGGDRMVPRLKGRTASSFGTWDEVAEFFDVNYSTAQLLFSPSHYPNEHGVSAKQVKLRVDALLGGTLDAFIEQGG
jgi:hypothetical protein